MQESVDDSLHKEVALALEGAVRRAIRVAGRDDEGNLQKVSHAEFSRRLKMSRSQLSRLISPSEGDLPNPDLRTICAIADELGVPPAFLLLRPADWQTIGVSMDEFAKHRAHDAIAAWRERFAARSDLGPAESAAAAKDLAHVHGILFEPSPKADYGLLERASATVASIINTAALAPLMELHADHIPELITLCAYAGSTARPTPRGK